MSENKPPKPKYDPDDIGVILVQLKPIPQGVVIIPNRPLPKNYLGYVPEEE